MNTKGYIISAVLAGLLIGCGGGSSSSSDDTTSGTSGSTTDESGSSQTGETSTSALKKVTLTQSSTVAKSTMVKDLDTAENYSSTYADANDMQINAIGGCDGYVVLGTKWHNSVTVIDASNGSSKTTIFNSLSGAAHNTLDSTTGASEPTIRQITCSGSNVYANVEVYNSYEKPHSDYVGLFKLTIGDGMAVSQSASASGTSFSKFALASDDSALMTYDGSDLVTYSSALAEQGSASADGIQDFTYDSATPLVAYNNGTKYYLSNSSTSLTTDIEFDFVPAYVFGIDASKAIAIKESSGKAIEIATVDLTNKTVSDLITVNEVTSGGTYSVSPNGRFLAVSHSGGLSIVELYSGAYNVLTTNEDAANAKGVAFAGNSTLAYATSSEAVLETLTETDETLTQSDLIAQKLSAKITTDSINNSYAFNEIRNDMNLSTSKIYDTINVTYAFSDNLSSIISSTGVVTTPATTTSGTLTVTGNDGTNTGSIEIPVRVIGEDLSATTKVLSGEEPINSVVLGDDRVAVALEGGIQVYKINGGNLEAVGSTVAITGIDSLVPRGIFIERGIYAVDDNTIVGLGRVDSGKTVKMEGRNGDETVKVYNYKIFKTTISDDGVVNPAATFIDAGTNDISDIDLSQDKKTLGILVYPSDGQYVADSENAGYYIGNEEAKTIKLYSMESNAITGTYPITRASDDETVTNAISLNEDGSLIMVSENHEPSYLKVYNNSGEKVFTGNDTTHSYNHMSASFLVGQNIFFGPFKASSFSVANISDAANPTYTSVDYVDGGGWLNKGVVDGNTLYLANTIRYQSTKAGVVKYTIGDSSATEVYYKMFGGETTVSLSDVDFAGDKAILTGYQNNDGYLNIQDKQ